MVTVGKTSTGRPICKPLKPESYFPTYNDAYAALVEYNKDPENIMGGIIGALKKKGFSTYSHENNIIVAPPLIITETELRDAMAIMDEVLADVDAMI